MLLWLSPFPDGDVHSFHPFFLFGHNDRCTGHGRRELSDMVIVAGDAIVTGASTCIGMAFSADVLADQIKITSKGPKVAVFVARDEVYFFL